MYRKTLMAAALAAVPWAAATAQLDYRNLDDERPVTTEDAYPIEHQALELMVPVAWESTQREGSLQLSPEVMWGALRNAMVGAKLPLGTGGGDGDGVAVGGPRLFALLNLNTEMPSLPALSVRGDLSLPWGDQAGSGVLASVKGIATRAWGTWRAHLNGSRSFGAAGRAPTLDPPTRWLASLAIDRTLWRQSLLVLGEVQAGEPLGASRTEWRAGLGVRWQATPLLVLDIGAYRRLSSTGPDLGLTMGLSRTLGLGGLGRPRAEVAP
jgi:hypothetical protein